LVGFQEIKLPQLEQKARSASGLAEKCFKVASDVHLNALDGRTIWENQKSEDECLRHWVH
jgi:hypothetical protein